MGINRAHSDKIFNGLALWSELPTLERDSSLEGRPTRWGSA